MKTRNGTLYAHHETHSFVVRVSGVLLCGEGYYLLTGGLGALPQKILWKYPFIWWTFRHTVDNILSLFLFTFWYNISLRWQKVELSSWQYCHAPLLPDNSDSTNFVSLTHSTTWVRMWHKGHLVGDPHPSVLRPIAERRKARTPSVTACYCGPWWNVTDLP